MNIYDASIVSKLFTLKLVFANMLFKSNSYQPKLDFFRENTVWVWCQKQTPYINNIHTLVI